MKITILITFIFLISLSFVQAALPSDPSYISDDNIDIWAIIARALNWFFGISIIFAVIILIYAGFLYITSNGNENKIKTANKILIFVFIGIIITLLAKALPNLVQEFLYGTKTSSSNLNNYSLNNLSNDKLNNISDSNNSLNLDFSQEPLGGYVYDEDPNVPLENKCHWDNNALQSDHRCGLTGGSKTAKVLLYNSSNYK